MPIMFHPDRWTHGQTDARTHSQTDFLRTIKCAARLRLPPITDSHESLKNGLDHSIELLSLTLSPVINLIVDVALYTVPMKVPPSIEYRDTAGWLLKFNSYQYFQLYGITRSTHDARECLMMETLDTHQTWYNYTKSIIQITFKCLQNPLHMFLTTSKPLLQAFNELE